MQKIIYKIHELDCLEECRILERTFKDHPGIVKIDFDILHRQMQITYDAKVIDSGKIFSMIRSTGMHATLWEEAQKDAGLTFWNKYGRLTLCILSGLTLFLGFIFQVIGRDTWEDILDSTLDIRPPSFSSILCYFFSLLLGIWFVVPKALASLRHFRPDMNLLLVIAVLGAVAIDQWFEAATVAFLFSLSLLLESWSVERARKAINALLDLSPTLARVIDANTMEISEKKVEDVLLRERVLVRPGEKIPLDGVVIEGVSSVNQAPITGESMPVLKQEGDSVFAGTINEDGALEFQVTKEANDTTLARIIEMVRKARMRKAKSEQWVDRFARIYTPCMLIFALIVAFLPPLFFDGIWLDWIYRALVFLVIACPCALVISTPVSIVSGLTSAARGGVLIKGGKYLEAMGKVDLIAFDKTGTITLGKPVVQRMIPLNDHSEKELLEIAASLEAHSDHPLAKAITKKAQEMRIKISPAKQFQIFKGLGAEAVIEGKNYWIGSHRFMHETKRKESSDAHKYALELEDAGHSVVAIGDFSHICGLISLADEPRPYIQETLAAIKGLNVKEIVMLTGDNQATAQDLAQKLGFNRFYAELLPEDKVRIIENLLKKYKIVAMIGDGVNDAPAMAVSSFGIAMGAIGTDAAFETADIVLMTDDLSLIPWLIRHSRKTLKIIQQNISFSLGIKAVFIALTLFGFASLWMAIAADTGASLIVIFNGLRLLRNCPKTWSSLD